MKSNSKTICGIKDGMNMNLNELTKIFSNKNIKNMNQNELINAIEIIEYKIIKAYKYTNIQNTITTNQEIKNIQILQNIHDKINKQIQKILNKNTNT